jgi:recombinational DNA repair protein (RecF pathway)
MTIEICATCGEHVELTHLSPYGERICTACAAGPEWVEDGLDEPTTLLETTDE